MTELERDGVALPPDQAPNRADLFAALVKALGELTDVPKTRTANAGTYSYTYADLGDALEMARPILAKHGLGVVQPVSTGAKGVDVATTIIHSSGQSITFGPLTFPAGNTPQATGSAITYARRYSLLAALGLATEEDDDGAAASRGATKRPSQPARQQATAPTSGGGATGVNLAGLFAALKDAGVPNADRHEWASAALERKVESFSELTAADLPILLDAAKKRTASRQSHPVADNVVPMPTRPKEEPEGRTWHQELQAIVDGGGKAKFLAWCRAEKATNKIEALSDEQVRKAVMDLGGGS